MISDKYKFTESGSKTAHIPVRFEEYGRFCGLSSTNARILSLLSEEIIGMIRVILPNFTADIWAQNDKNTFEIIASVNATIKPEDRANLLKATGGKNSAYGKGLLGKIGGLFANWAIAINENPTVPMMAMSTSELGVGMAMFNGYEEWSMKTYLDSVAAEADKRSDMPEDDGLERSIIVSLADDCKMSVKSGSVVMTVTKAFEETGFSKK
jgi:hypothetical protein